MTAVFNYARVCLYFKASPAGSKSVKYPGHICITVPGPESPQHSQPSHVRLQYDPTEGSKHCTRVTHSFIVTRQRYYTFGLHLEQFEKTPTKTEGYCKV